MKKSISRETLSIYPNFNELFVAVISPGNKPINVYSRELNPA